MRTFFVFCLICTVGCMAYGQGSLTPVASPASSMKTLTQVEPRTPISSLPYNITQGGSYYVTTNLTGTAGTNGISIFADNVTLDLSGFTLTGVGGSENGIQTIGARFNITIHNGNLASWSEDGVEAGTVQNGIFSDLRMNANGEEGISAGANCIIDRCTATMNGDDGMECGTASTIKNCVSRSNGFFGYYVGGKSLITDSVAEDNTQAGIVADTGVRVSGCSSSDNNNDGFTGNGYNIFINCVAYGNAGVGIGANTASLVKNCVVNGNEGSGITANWNCKLVENSCFGNGLVAGGAGIYADTQSRIENNHITDGELGLNIVGAENYVAGNTVSGNKTNYNIAAGNQLNLLLSQIPETIAWPASVKLAGTLTGVTASHGIDIASDDVTIDFDGHALVGVSGSYDGVHVSSDRDNINIENGIVRGWGNDGIDLSSADNSRVTRMNVFSNSLSGIMMRNAAVVGDCTVKESGAYGIYAREAASILDCAVYTCSTGIYAFAGATISRCSARGNTGFGILVGQASTVGNCSMSANGRGLFAGVNSTIYDCSVAYSSSNGIEIAYGSMVRDCTSGQNGDVGIVVASESMVKDNTCDNNNIAAISVRGGGNRIDGNNLTDSGVRGIHVTTANNIIVRNSARNNSINYDIAAGNSVGGIVDVSGVGFTNTNPWVNFSF